MTNRVSPAALDLLLRNLHGFTEEFLYGELSGHPDRRVRDAARTELARRRVAADRNARPAQYRPLDR